MAESRDETVKDRSFHFSVFIFHLSFLKSTVARQMTNGKWKIKLYMILYMKFGV